MAGIFCHSLHLLTGIYTYLFLKHLKNAYFKLISVLNCRLQLNQVHNSLQILKYFIFLCKNSIDYIFLCFSVNRFWIIQVFGNIQDCFSHMDPISRSRIIQDKHCPYKLTKRHHWFCFVWSKHTNGLYQLLVTRSWVHLHSWGFGWITKDTSLCLYQHDNRWLLLSNHTFDKGRHWFLFF